MQEAQVGGGRLLIFLACHLLLGLPVSLAWRVRRIHLHPDSCPRSGCWRATPTELCNVRLPRKYVSRGPRWLCLVHALAIGFTAQLGRNVALHVLADGAAARGRAAPVPDGSS